MKAQQQSKQRKKTQKKIIKIVSIRKGLPKIRKTRLTDKKKERNSS